VTSAEYRVCLFLARTARSRHRSDSVCFLRDFCRADDASGRLTFDPTETSSLPTGCDAASL
jgi:hypothetical protein